MHEDEQFEVVAEGEYPFTMMPHWVALSPMSDGAFRLYNFLLMHLNMGSGTRKAWPSKASLAALMGFTKEDSLDRHLNQLYAMGAVTVQRHRNESNMKKRNTYTLRLTPPHGFQGHTILSDWYETRKQETAGQTVPPKKGVRTPEKGGSVPPKKGVKQEPLPQQQPLKEENPPKSGSYSSPVSPKPGDGSPSTELSIIEKREDVEQACVLLADLIEGNGSKRPRISDEWRRAARLLMDKDGRSLEQVLTAIRWSQNDEFWRGNVLSMPTLRKQYDKLRLAAIRERSQKQAGGRNDDLGTDAHIQRYAERRAAREAEEAAGGLPANLWDRALAIGELLEAGAV